METKNLHSKITFVRFGGLSSVPQEGYDKDPEYFHTPPTKKGFYAFVFPHIVPFLLGGNFSSIDTKFSKFEWVRDEDDNMVEAAGDDQYCSNFMKKFYTREKDGKEYWLKPKSPKYFTHEGELWHHLGEHLSPGQILARQGCWVLTSFYDYKIAFQKAKHSGYKLQFELFKGKKSNNPFYGISKDHLEVFIEKL